MQIHMQKLSFGKYGITFERGEQTAHLIKMLHRIYPGGIDNEANVYGYI